MVVIGESQQTAEHTAQDFEATGDEEEEEGNEDDI